MAPPYARCQGQTTSSVGDPHPRAHVRDRGWVRPSWFHGDRGAGACSRRFRARQAVPELTGQRRRRGQLRGSAAEIFGLLGPNGAGKTTTVGVLTTRVRPTAGSASVAGIDVVARPGSRRAARSPSIPQRSNLDRALSIRANLDLPRRLPRRPGRGAQPPRRRAARAVRAARPREAEARHVLGRPVAAGDDRAGADARPRGALPRRALDRARPGRAALRLGPAPRAARPRRDARAHHARHGRGGGARRPGRDHGSRHAARARHARRR